MAKKATTKNGISLLLHLWFTLHRGIQKRLEVLQWQPWLCRKLAKTVDALSELIDVETT